LALNSVENRLRVLMMARPLHRRIHLNRLSQDVGPPLSSSDIIISPLYHNDSSPQKWSRFPGTEWRRAICRLLAGRAIYQFF
jgi:hypothetical protein